MLLYVVIARSTDGIILVESTSAGVEGNHPQVMQQLVQALVRNTSLVAKGNRKTFAHSGPGPVGSPSVSPSASASASASASTADRTNIGSGLASLWSSSDTLENYFHVQRGENTYLIALSDDRDAQNQRTNFGFLLDTQKHFIKKYTPSKIEKANAYQFDKAFQKTLSNLMHHSNTNRNDSSNSETAKLNADVESIKKTMDINLDLLVRRGVRMETLMEKSDDLMIESQVFNKRSLALKRVMKKKALYYKIILVGFGIITIYLMMVKLCGFDLSCQAKNEDNDDGGGRF